MTSKYIVLNDQRNNSLTGVFKVGMNNKALTSFDLGMATNQKVSFSGLAPQVNSVRLLIDSRHRLMIDLNGNYLRIE